MGSSPSPVALRPAHARLTQMELQEARGVPTGPGLSVGHSRRPHDVWVQQPALALALVLRCGAPGRRARAAKVQTRSSCRAGGAAAVAGNMVEAPGPEVRVPQLSALLARARGGSPAPLRNCVLAPVVAGQALGWYMPQATGVAAPGLARHDRRRASTPASALGLTAAAAATAAAVRVTPCLDTAVHRLWALHRPPRRWYTPKHLHCGGQLQR